jgi:hypothetical protein
MQQNSMLLNSKNTRQNTRLRSSGKQAVSVDKGRHCYTYKTCTVDMSIIAIQTNTGYARNMNGRDMITTRSNQSPLAT